MNCSQLLPHDSVAPSTTGARESLAGFDANRLERLTNWIDKLVSDKKLAGASVLISRHGKLAYSRYAGLADRERNTPMAADTIVRVKSMTKPITAAAIVLLYEEAHFQLDDPISRFLPYFENQRVFVGGTADDPQTVSAERGISFRDLLTHTSGLTYGFTRASLVDAMYRSAGVDFQLDSPLRDGPPTGTLGEMVELAASMPLLAHPGTRWNYSISTDVLGYLVQVVSGMPYDQFVIERIIKPLGMSDTSFQVPAEKRSRFAAHYEPSPTGLRLIDDPESSPFSRTINLHSGGGGIVSTGEDYLKFCRMLLEKGLVGKKRLLGRKTVELMMSNHLCGDVASMGCPTFSGQSYEGIGFGLGGSVMLDPARAQVLGSPGEFAWWGSASTAFWIDPVEDMAVVFLTQLTPATTYPLRKELRSLVYQALN